MVTTIDGKILSGNRDEHVMDLGSKADHQALRDLEAAADAVITGAETIRATPKIWFDRRLVRLTMTRSGDLPWDRRFFTDAPEQAIVASPSGLSGMPSGVEHWQTNDPAEILRRLRNERGIQKLVIEGGSELNAVFLRAELVDELFLTVAPKVKLGRDIPTYAGGEPLERSELLQFELVSCVPIESELFIRYRRRK
jgi:riboflavin biosynthesis pyrimidine reductase